MKVKINKCSDPTEWYADRIGVELEVEHFIAALDMPDRIVAKTWNWYWKRDEIQTIASTDCFVTDGSGSAFEDGLQLGLALGKEEYRKELIAEGILEKDEFDDEDEDEPCCDNEQRGMGAAV